LTARLAGVEAERRRARRERPTETLTGNTGPDEIAGDEPAQHHLQ